MYRAKMFKDPPKIGLIHLVLFISGRNFEAELLRLDIFNVLVFFINLRVEMAFPEDIET